MIFSETLVGQFRRLKLLRTETWARVRNSCHGLRIQCSNGAKAAQGTPQSESLEELLEELDESGASSGASEPSSGASSGASEPSPAP